MPTIHALLVALTYPLGLSTALLLVAALALVFRRRKSAAALAALAVCWSVVWSVPAVSDWLRQSLEDRHPVVAEAALPKADAIVVLGGGAYEWTLRTSDNPDDLVNSRLAAGARAWRAGLAPTVILSGGRGRPGHTEAQNMAKAMARFGVPASALVLEQRSRDTRDNAAFTAILARERGMKRVLLVTSALHMPRASLLFQRRRGRGRGLRARARIGPIGVGPMAAQPQRTVAQWPGTQGVRGPAGRQLGRSSGAAGQAGLARLNAVTQHPISHHERGHGP